MPYDDIQSSAIKRVSLVRLRKDLPRAACLRHWGGAHARIVRALPGVLEYTVDVAADPRADDAWDAVATLRFADDAALRGFLAPDVQADLLATREDFAEAVDAFLVDERILIPSGGTR